MMPLLVSKIQAAGMGPGAAAAFTADTADTLTATGTNQATAYETSTAVARFTTVPAATGVLLDNGARGDSQFIINDGANPLSVYPHVGGSINGLATNAAFSVAAGSWAMFGRYTDTRWVGGNDASTVSFIQSGTGAVARPLQDKAREIVALADYDTSGHYDTARTGTSIDLTIPGKLNVNSTLLVGANGTISSSAVFEARSSALATGMLVNNTNQSDGNFAPIFIAAKNAAGTVSNVSLEAITVSAQNTEMIVRTGGSGVNSQGTVVARFFNDTNRGRMTIGNHTSPRGQLDIKEPDFAAIVGEAPSALKVAGGTITSLDASTEVMDINFKFPGTLTFKAGAIATQRTFGLQTPRTYAFESASTITTAATLGIEGPPVAGTNCTITTTLSLWVQAGNTQLDGNLAVNGAGGLDVVASSNVALRMGSNTTNSTLKQGRVTSRHYTNAEEDVSTIIVLADSATNDIYFGGGSGTVNAATSLIFYAAANNTTTTGTEVARATINGLGVFLTPISTTALTLPAGTTARSSLSVPHGSAPTSPVNGDIWTTTAGLFVRINGGTVGPLT